MENKAMLGTNDVRRFADNTVRWTPNNGTCVLDGLQTEQHKLFRYIITRNGHNVALFGGRESCEKALRDRTARFPLDTWGMIDREVSQ